LIGIEEVTEGQSESEETKENNTSTDSAKITSFAKQGEYQEDTSEVLQKLLKNNIHVYE